MILLLNSWVFIFLINTKEVPTLKAFCLTTYDLVIYNEWSFLVNQNVGQPKAPNSSIIWNLLWCLGLVRHINYTPPVGCFDFCSPGRKGWWNPSHGYRDSPSKSVR